jgi:hypothetical protein
LPGRDIPWREIGTGRPPAPSYHKPTRSVGFQTYGRRVGDSAIPVAFGQRGMIAPDCSP